MNQTTPQEPAAGGSYVRNPDGSLTSTQRTEPAQGRAAKQPAAEPAPAEPAAPAAPASTAIPQE